LQATQTSKLKLFSDSSINIKAFVLLLLPLFLFSPIIVLGNFGFSIAEIICLILGPIFIIMYKGTIKLPWILLLFFLLCIVGRIGAFVNSLHYNIPFNYSKLVLLFIITVQIISFVLGRYSSVTTLELVSGKFVKIIFSLLAIYAFLYLVSDVDLRYKLLRPFFQKNVDIGRFMSPRFPGLGINANIFSFCIYMFLVLSLKHYFQGKISFFLTFLCLFIILLVTSKTTIINSVFALIVFAIAYLGKNKIYKNAYKKSLNVFIVLGVFFLLMLIGAAFFSEYIIIFQRFDELTGKSEGVNSIDDRYTLWQMGIERIKLAPILGIDVVQSNLITDSNLLYFATPHNEFLFYWMSTGITGALAYVVFILYMIILNIKRHIRLEWVLIYLALIMQMIFDGAFQTLRFEFFFFIFLGINFREIVSVSKVKRNATN
jgi:O-antigen ligase